MHHKLIQYTAQTSTQTAKPSYTADAILDHGVPDEEASIFPNLFTREALERKVREVLVTNKASTLGIVTTGSETGGMPHGQSRNPEHEGPEKRR